jgi:hypothetical protein
VPAAAGRDGEPGGDGTLAIEAGAGDPGSSFVGGESGGMVSGAVAAFREGGMADAPADREGS